MINNTSAHLASAARVVRAVAHAHSVSVTSYVLRPESALVATLVAAAKHGARVNVTLAGDRSSKAVQPTNEATAALIRAAGGRVYFDRQHKGQPPLHMKSIVADRSAFLDDRNWTFGDDETIIEDSNPADVKLVRRSQFMANLENEVLTTKKSTALAVEADAIRAGSGHTVDVETESFNAGVVERALAERAQRGDRVRLLVLEGDVKPGNRKVLEALVAAGVAIRVSGGSDPTAGAEKMALAGERTWLGSANATSQRGNTVDWGMLTADGAITARLHRHFERDWAAGSAL